MMRIGGNVQASRLIKQEKPAYPPEAKSRGITGTVAFEALIGKDGKIHRLEMLSGPLALYQSSRNAMSRWEYKPTLLNGDPVEVLTTLDMNYMLN
jgi:protein TonB